MKRAVKPLVLMFMLWVATVGVAQQRGSAKSPQKPGPRGGAESPREQVIREFEAKSPSIGTPLPDITILDAEGREFPLRNLKGDYTVLVFGCLT